MVFYSQKYTFLCMIYLNHVCFNIYINYLIFILIIVTIFYQFFYKEFPNPLLLKFKDAFILVLVFPGRCLLLMLLMFTC